MNTLSKLWSILPVRERLSAVGLVGWMLAAMLLEMVSVGLVLPALVVMTGEGFRKTTPFADRWLAWLGEPSQGQLVLIGLAALLGLYVVKACVLILSQWRQLRFVARVEADLSQRLLTTYLAQPWTFHLQRNSAELIRTIGEVPTLSYLLASMLNALAELLVLAGIVAVLFYFEPVGAVAVAVLIACSAWLLDRLTKGRLIRSGQFRFQQAAIANKAVLQGLGAAKEIKLAGSEDQFVSAYAATKRASALAHAKQTFLGQLPRFWYELLAVAALCLLAAVLVFEGRPRQSMIPVIGMFAAAAFRILPSVNRLSSAMLSLRSCAVPLDVVARELALGEPAAPAAQKLPPPLPIEESIAVEKACYRYPGGAADALHDVSLVIPCGKAVGIIGTTGAGKSTLIDVMLGLLVPSSGRVTVDGHDIAASLASWQRTVGYVPQSIYLTDDTIRRNIAFGIRDDEIDETAVRQAVAAACLTDFVASLPAGIDTVIGERGVRLSGGQRQRIGIARALYRDPQVLVFDEATSALDDGTEKEVMAAVNRLHGEKTLVIVAHRLSTVSSCDIVYRVESGRVIHAGVRAAEQASDAARA